jgi:hypothetical protein
MQVSTMHKGDTTTYRYIQTKRANPELPFCQFNIVHHDIAYLLVNLKIVSDFSKRELCFHGCILNRATTRVLLRIITGNILSIKAHFRFVIISLLVFENHLFRRTRVSTTNAYDMWVLCFGQ